MQVGTELVFDIWPGRQSSSPEYIVNYDSHLYFSARGVDTSWQLREHLSDDCSGMRVSSYDSRVVYVVDDTGIWDEKKIYDCPSGYTWMTTDQAFSIFHASNERLVSIHDDPLVYFNQCGWDGYEFGGIERKRFLFSDSSDTYA